VIVTDAVGCAVDDPAATTIEHLARLASVVLNAHVNRDGPCAVCGSAFPCESAVLAERNAALL